MLGALLAAAAAAVVLAAADDQGVRQLVMHRLQHSDTACSVQELTAGRRAGNQGSSWTSTLARAPAHPADAAPPVRRRRGRASPSRHSSPAVAVVGAARLARRAGRSRRRLAGCAPRGGRSLCRMCSCSARSSAEPPAGTPRGSWCRSVRRPGRAPCSPSLGVHHASASRRCTLQRRRRRARARRAALARALLLQHHSSRAALLVAGSRPDNMPTIALPRRRAVRGRREGTYLKIHHQARLTC